MDSEYPLKLPLSKTYSFGDGSFSDLSYREPRYPDYVKEGDAQQWIHGDGNRWLATSPEIIAAYVDRIFERPDHAQVLNLTDTFLVEETIIDFFIEARRFNAMRDTSSGASNGDQAISET